MLVLPKVPTSLFSLVESAKSSRFVPPVYSFPLKHFEWLSYFTSAQLIPRFTTLRLACSDPSLWNVKITVVEGTPAWYSIYIRTYLPPILPVFDCSEQTEAN